MALKKKIAEKKISKEKKPNGVRKSRFVSVKRTTKKMVDDFLIKVNPQVQKQVDHLKSTLEKTPTSISDLKMLGLRVLERAKNLSQTLRAESKALSKTNASQKKRQEK
jgi:hypothetical protein